jgi:Short C-terminal domain
LDRSAVLSQLKDLGELKAAGVLTDVEFEQQKALILGN